ncbi:MAG: hypothetical protein JO041_06980 [Acidobacteria bacterium]|nr:hypothetical protein [Acidobacteriota bacterium]
MKKTVAALTTLFLLPVCAGLAFAVQDSPKATMTGWVMDAKCGAKMANEKGAACAKRCVERGEAVVFVDDKDQSVLKVSNQDALKSHAGEHVTVSGSVDSGSLHVDNVSAAK